MHDGVLLFQTLQCGNVFWTVSNVSFTSFQTREKQIYAIPEEE